MEEDGDESFDIGEYMAYLNEWKGKTANSMLNGGEIDGDEEIGKNLNLRDYQTELAKSVISGDNVLICAPTGTGKTLVAVKIVEDHLAGNPKGKVAFLVNQTLLADQQYQLFSEYLGGRIYSTSGVSKSQSTPLLWNIENSDIFILTSDILRNALEEKNENRIESINVFSLVLFDECHNCEKKHPYNRIMWHYFNEKDNGRPVPQIVGLTASTGTNKANSLDAALDQLFTLCGNLDSHIVSTVRDYKDELDTYSSKPHEGIITPDARSKDIFDSDLQAEMEFCEDVIKDLNEKQFFPQDNHTQSLLRFPEDRFLQKYSNIIGTLGTDIFNVTPEFKDAKATVFIIVKYLKVFYEALMINHLFRSADAIKYVRDEIGLLNGNTDTLDVETTLRNRTNEMITKHENIIHPINPCLEYLKNKIKSQFTLKEDSRIIVFVRDRIYTQILKDVFSCDCSSTRCDIMLGNQGSTKNETHEVLSRFRKNIIRILFSTTIAEEGLDIPSCNMVIKYGHVTNETSRIQSRGRARAQDSDYIVIVPRKLMWQVSKEYTNKNRESLMYKAIETFQSMDEDTIKKRVPLVFHQLLYSIISKRLPSVKLKEN